MVIGLERGADLHMAQLMPLPLTVSCFSKIQTGFTFLVPVQRAVKWVCVSVNSPGNPWSQSRRRNGGLWWEGFAEKESFKPGVKK